MSELHNSCRTHGKRCWPWGFLVSLQPGRDRSFPVLLILGSLTTLVCLLTCVTNKFKKYTVIFVSVALPSLSPVHGILQARIPEWVTIPFSRGFSWPSDWTWFSCIAGGFFTFWATRETYMNSNTDKFPSCRTEPVCIPTRYVWGDLFPHSLA